MKSERLSVLILLMWSLHFHLLEFRCVVYQIYNSTQRREEPRNVALNVISKKTCVTDIAKQYDVSRQFIYRQKDRAISAVDDAFDETST